MSNVCKHTPVEGEWISAAHVVRCLGVPHASLVQALLGERVSYLITGREPRQSLRVKASEAFAEWPFAFAGGHYRTPERAPAREQHLRRSVTE